MANSFNAGNVDAKLTMDTKNFHKGIMTARTEVGQLQKSTSTMSGKMVSAGNKMAGVGTKLSLGLTAPIMGIGVASLKTAANFEKGMSEVKAISGASQEDFEKLNDTAKDLGANTAFSATEAAEGMKYLAMAGMDTNEIVDSMPGMLDLAAASGTDLGTTADIVSDSLTAFGLEASDSAHLADVMAIASSDANTSVEMLGESYKYVAPVAGAFNYSMEDTTAALAVMAGSGIKASQAGTSLRGALLRMSDGSGAAGKKMAELGIEMADSEGNMLPLNNVLGQLKDSFAGLTEEEQAQAASALFGKNAVSGMLAVINDSGGKFDELSESMRNGDGAAKEMADTMLDNLSGSFTLLESAIKGAAITIGEYLIPFIRKAADQINKWVSTFNNLDDSTKKTIIKIVMLVAAIGPVLFIVGKTIAMFGKLKGLFMVLAGPAGPIIAIIAAIVAVVAIFVHLYKTNEEFRDKVNKVWTTIKEDGQEIFEALGRVIKVAMEFIQETINIALIWIKQFWTEWGEDIKIYFSAFWNIIKDTVLSAFTIIEEVIKLALSIITGDWRGAWESIKIIFSTFITWIGNTLTNFTTMWRTVWGAVLKIVVDKFIEIKEDVVQKVIELIDGIKSFFTDFKTVGGDMIHNLWDGIKGVWGRVSSWVREKVKWLKEKLTFWKKSEEKMNKSSVKTYSSSNDNFDPYKNQSEHYAQGTMDARKGWHWVGENGPELRKFEGGETVLPAKFSKAITSAKSTVSGLSTNSINNGISKLSAGATNLNIKIQEMSVRNDGDIKLIADEVMSKVNAKLSGSTQTVMNQIRREARL